MIDIKKIFENSISLISKKKQIIYPRLYSTIVNLFLIFLFIHLSGLYPALKEIVTVQKDFDELKLNYLLDFDNVKDGNYILEWLNYIGKDSSSSKYNDDFTDYANEGEYDFEKLKDLWNLKNIILGIIFIILFISITFYFTMMSYVMILRTIKRKKPYVSNKIIRNYVWRFITVKTLLAMIFIIPLSIFILGVFLESRSIIITLLVSIFAYLAYLIYMALKLFFTTPAIFMDDTGSVQAIRQSYRITKGHLKQVFLVVALVSGIGILSYSFLTQPYGPLFSEVMFNSSFLIKTLNILLLLIFIILEAIVITFQRVYTFYSYTEYKAYIKKQHGGK